METLPDVYGARQWLIDEMEISPAQIGVMGLSFGGVAAMLVATEEYSATYSHDGENFAAAMPVYPVCWIYGTVPGYDFARLDTLSVEILTGSEDGYDDDPATCPELVSRLTADEQTRVKVHVLKGAHHSFDKPGSDRLVDDPYSHRGTGGVVQMRYDPALTQRSHAHAVDFFKRNLEVE
jgi:dienelactone hydrolase